MKALIVVDVQHDFISKNGKLPVPGALDIVETIHYCIKKAREKGMKIIYTKDWHTKEDEEFKIFPKHCIENTDGAEIVELIIPQKNDTVIFKQTISAWSEDEIYMNDIDEVYVTGVATEYCVKAFVDGALDRGKKVTLIVDAIKGVDEIPGVNKTRGAVAIACIEMGKKGVGHIFSDDFGKE